MRRLNGVIVASGGEPVSLSPSLAKRQLMSFSMPSRGSLLGAISEGPLFTIARIGFQHTSTVIGILTLTSIVCTGSSAINSGFHG